MNRDETKEFLFKVSAIYPNWKPQNLTYAIDAWSVVLSNYQKDQIETAFAAYVSTDTSGFAPSPGQLLGIIRKASQNPLETMTALEAWGLVYKAICNSGYNAEAEFSKLPELCKKAIGSPDNLKEMALMDTSTVMSVEQSHFIRAYESLLKRIEEREQIPLQVREAIGAASKLIEG